MCGIAGIFNLHREGEISQSNLERMIAMVRHRGPDGVGFFRDKRAGLAHTRLSIIDLKGGHQPMKNEDETIIITFNGEIFNYLELREILLHKGHIFSTLSDTEVVIHLYEEFGTDCLAHLNGQFAFAIWDKKKELFFLARDRVGIRPLFYTRVNNSLLFASEIKSLFADSRVPRELDPCALDQIFTFWMTIPPRTAFRDIFELPAGHFITVKRGVLKQHSYWNPDFTPRNILKNESEYAEELLELLINATKLQLRADVPVGAYLSGGLDSSSITTLIRKYTSTPLRTFSITFHDDVYDESDYQQQMIDFLDTDHTDIKCSYSDIGTAFPDVIWHTEKPIIRTAPAPLFLLSRQVRESGYKVVLTGEGSDEIFAGYDIFKETKVRHFLEKNSGSNFRPLILKKLYPYLAHSPVRSVQYAEAFFCADTYKYPAEYYSHIPRWNMTAKCKAFFSEALKSSLLGYNNIGDLSDCLSNDFRHFDSISQAQYIEIKTLLSSYLLSSQGDRVAMAHSVEGRFPFLDHRLIDFSCKLPPTIRMRALTEKYILKKSMKNLLPENIVNRTKQPYMAPDAKSFFMGSSLDYLDELLSERYLAHSGFFNPKSVLLLVKKCRQNSMLGFKDNMAIVGIISTLLVYDQFIKQFKRKTDNGKEQTEPIMKGSSAERRSL